MSQLVSLPENQIKELMSVGYVTSIAARAGLGFDVGGIHDFGVDGQFWGLRQWGRSNSLSRQGVAIDAQLKASSTGWDRLDDCVTYTLKVKAYNEIAIRNQEKQQNPAMCGIPLILILFCIPNDDLLWLSQSEEELILRDCCYFWYHTDTITTNKTTIKIEIPRTQLLTPESLRLIWEKAQKGGIY